MAGVSAEGAQGQLRPYLLQSHEHQIQRVGDSCPNSALPLLRSPPQSASNEPKRLEATCAARAQSPCCRRG